MRIRRLKLSGFKSFVEPAELRIEPGLTGVVGPNGCGKSNLLEAIRWTMGESSPKSLRGGGMDDVIFAGTATRPPRDFAEVSILLERDADENSAAGESEVTRRIERGTGSAYRIDGRDVRAKDVSLLFADAATGAHSPALVSQGKIGAVIAAKPVERRLLLEEAAGISGLHARRKDAEQKLRATEANLARLGEMLNDQEQRAAQLRRQARAAERYRKITDQIRLVEARLLHARWAEAEKAAEAALADARGAGDAVAAIQTAIADAQAAQERTNVLLTDKRNALTQMREQAHELAHQLATARARRDTVARRLLELERLDAALAADIGREEALKGDAARAIAQLEEERQVITQRLDDAESIAARLAAELTATEALSRDAEAALAELLARQAAMRAERRVAEAALESAKAQSVRVQQERQKLAQQLEALGGGVDHEAARDEAQAKAEAASRQLAEAEAQRATAEEARAGAAEQRDAAESRLAAARATFSAAKSEHEALARALEHGAGGVIASLRAQPGYERALAAALGEDADAAVGAEGGRRWQGSELQDGDPALPAGTECLADHVSAPTELLRRLRQIAVADEDTGQRLAVGQRLVTREGALRRWDGFVAIGSGAAAAERLLRANRLAELARDLPSLEEASKECAAQRDEALAAMEQSRALAEQARHAALAAERDARDAARAGDAATAALERIEAHRLSLTQREGELRPVIEAALDSVKASERALTALPDPAALEQEVIAAREKAGAASTTVAEKRAEIATRSRETASDRERHATAGREQSEWRKRQSDAEQRLSQAIERREQLAAERNELEQEPAELDRRIGELEQANSESQVRVGEAAAAEREAEEAVVIASTEVSAANERFADARERRASAAARAEAQQARSSDFARSSVDKFECVPQRLPELFAFDPTEVADADVEATQLERLVAERERIGPVNLIAEKELAELDEARGKGAAEAEELTQAIHRLRGSIGNLNREGRVRLLEAYEKVDAHFRRLFTTLFDGGQAHLQLVESDDPLEAGLEIMAQPPGKRLSTLTLLSGGEQALTAVALIFAIFLTNPAPICVLDEVDAPLDDANVERFCDLLDRMTQETDTRYLIVTHNAVTMSRMHRLYGVTMIEKGVSRLVSVDLGGAETLLAAE
ncbi:chromosome segregation SMC family protein [Sphingomonas hankyongi]|uniref:Chromosome partition protein Smc n=1 Tax=Sphingomonas hankyongi TaxID=2908209 RepID=A0ABT0S206_9SPHN|nr:AAA family ATPase [Sphingomonas hankyongi]MCL6729899.1 AAA family ATPase [Sphingomonas hankyongi]